MMQFKFNSWSDYHHQIYRMYHGIIALSLLPFFLVFLELEVASIKEARVPQIWVNLVLVVLIPVCVVINWKVWKSEFFKYLGCKNLKEKLIEFRRVEVKKYLALELVCFFALLGLWLTAHYLFVIIYFAVLVQFSFLRPSEQRIVREMKLTKNEQQNLRAEVL